MHASQSDCIIPRSWKDFGAWPFASVSGSLVDAIEECRGEDSFAGSGDVGFEWVGVAYFTLFDNITSFLYGLPSAFLFLIGDMLSVFDNAHSEAVCAPTRNISALALSIRAAKRGLRKCCEQNTPLFIHTRQLEFTLFQLPYNSIWHGDAQRSAHMWGPVMDLKMELPPIHQLPESQRAWS